MDYPLVYVEFDDPCTCARWQSLPPGLSDTACRMVGWLVSETDEQITVMACLSGSEGTLAMTVPLSSVRTWWEVLL